MSMIMIMITIMTKIMITITVEARDKKFADKKRRPSNLNGLILEFDDFFNLSCVRNPWSQIPSDVFSFKTT